MERAMRVNRASDNFGRDLAVANRIRRTDFVRRWGGALVSAGIESCSVWRWNRGAIGKSGSRAAALQARVAFSFCWDVRARFFCELLHKHCAMGACVVIK